MPTLRMSDTASILKETIAIARTTTGETREHAIDVAFRLMDRLVEEEREAHPIRVPESRRYLRHTS